MEFLSNKVLVLIPQKKFLEWIAQVIEHEEIESVDLKKIDNLDVYNGCSLYITPPLEDKEQSDGFIKTHHKDILTNELARFVPEKRYWPKELSLELLYQFFALEFHNSFVDLTSLKPKETP